MRRGRPSNKLCQVAMLATDERLAYSACRVICRQLICNCLKFKACLQTLASTGNSPGAASAISRAVGRLGTGKSSNCRSEGVRAVVRTLVSNKLSLGSLALPWSARKRRPCGGDNRARHRQKMGYDSDDWWEEFHEPGGEYYDHEFEGAYGSEALRQHQEARARRRRLTKEFRRTSEQLMGACYSGDAAEVTRIYDEGGPKHFDPYGNIVTDTWSE